MFSIKSATGSFTKGKRVMELLSAVAFKKDLKNFRTALILCQTTLSNRQIRH